MPDETTESSSTAIDNLACWSLADEPAFRDKLALQQAKLLVLDSLGCAFAALADHAMDEVVGAVHAWGGTPESTVIGGQEKTSVLNAVLANGALVRVLDLNDLQFIEKDGALAVSGHASDNIPVALAVGEKLGVSGLAVLESIVMAYELYHRLRKLMAENSQWDPSSVSGLIGAAVTGRLMRLSPDRQANALGLAAARTAVPRIVRKGEMSAGKSLANALVAQNGVQSALLAATGLTGPREALDHRDGLNQVFEPARGLAILWEKTGQPPAILSSHMKSYPCIGTAQTLVTATLDLHDKLRGRLQLIKKIEVIMSDVPFVRHQQADRKRSNPQTREAADHSFTFLPCVALMDGELTSRQFENERWIEPETRRLMDRVEMGVAADLRDRALGSMPCRLRVQLTSGEEVVSECLYPPGHSFPDKGLNPQAIKAKFHAFSEPVLSEDARARIIDAVERVDGAASIRGMMSLLSVDKFS